MKKVLVTGGAGYIGSIMVRRLLDDGQEVVVVDDLGRGHEDAIDKRAIFIKGNLLDKNFIENVFAGHDFDSVVHFAGFISMGESMKAPSLYFENNVFTTLNILEVMKGKNVKKFIFSSTAGVYGNPIETPISEDNPKNPTNPYGESKLMVEKVLAWYQIVFDINYIALRYFNAAGALLDSSLGELHVPETHIIPNALESVMKDSEFELFGNDYKTPDGTAIRDYIHVSDLIDAHVLALSKLDRDRGGFVYNVGTGKGWSNKEVLEMVKKVTGKEIKIKVSPKRPGDSEILVADSTKIKTELGFNPVRSDLETIVDSAWNFYKMNTK